MYAKAVSSLAQWLCPTEFDRKRAVDTSVRVRRARMTVGLLIGSATLLLIRAWAGSRSPSSRSSSPTSPA